MQIAPSVSAGTWLGSRYATLFPKQVGRFVLDSNTEFTAPFAKTFGNQPMAFQRPEGQGKTGQHPPCLQQLQHGVAPVV